MLKNVLNALADGFGYVIASLVGALVALSFSLPEPIPEWYYIGTITVALAGAVVIALLRRGIDEALPVRIEEENPREGQHDDVGEYVDAKHREVMADLHVVKAELQELRRPWWRRWSISVRGPKVSRRRGGASSRE